MPAERLFSRALVRLSPQGEGEDVADFLQGLVTQDVTGQLPAWAGLLTPQGKALFDFIVWPAGHGELLIDCEADAADDLIKRLSMYRLRVKICIERDGTLGVYWQAELGDGGAPDPRLHELGQRWIAKTSPDDKSADDAWRQHRLALGVPEGRAELADVLWLETNAAELNGVSFSKGCYVGQENTARMNWRAKVNRRLVVLEGSGERARIHYPDLGLAVAHVRVDSVPDNAIIPGWLEPALSSTAG